MCYKSFGEYWHELNKNVPVDNQERQAEQTPSNTRNNPANTTSTTRGALFESACVLLCLRAIAGLG